LRILNILSGVAVLLTTLAFAHLVHHFFSQSPHDARYNPVFSIGFTAAILVGLLSFLGACLLLRSVRRNSAAE
jgi:hypothetical protein